MQDDSRRQFLARLTAMSGAISLAACGSGSSSSPSPSPAPTPTPAPPPAPTPPPPSPAGTPAWLQDKPLNTWFAIPGTVHAGSPAAPADDPNDIYASSNRRLAYSGMGLRGTEIVMALNGGHGDYAGNEVTSLELNTDAPQWVLRSPASPSPTIDVPYYADGKPSSRHTYWSTIWNEQHQRLLAHRSRFVYGSGISFDNTNGFDLATNTWDAKSTWANGYSAGCADSDGNAYAVGINYFSIYKWTAATDTWAELATYADATTLNPICFDATRAHVFAMGFGDGQGNNRGPGRTLTAFTLAGATKTEITFAPGAAVDQFIADAPNYCAMEYDPVNDHYLFYEGAAGHTDRVYVVEPNAGAQWDLSILALGAGSVAPPAAVGAGIYNRFKYVPALRGIVLLSSGTSDVFFMRTA